MSKVGLITILLEALFYVGFTKNWTLLAYSCSYYLSLTLDGALLFASDG